MSRSKTSYWLLLCLLLMSPAWAQEMKTATVAMVLPGQTDASRELRLSGSLVPVQRSRISSRVDGAVLRLAVDVGARVAQGDLLLELDDSLERHELQRLAALQVAAAAVADETRRQVDEARRLTRNKHLSQDELARRRAALAEARAGLDAAKAALAVQQQRLDWHHISAPFAGVVVRKLTEAGEWVGRGTEVLELVATEHLYLDVQVPQEYYADINTDSEITIHPDASPALALPGRIAARVPVADAASRTFRLRLASLEPNPALLPGASARAVFTLKNPQDKVLTVPRDALLRNPDGGFSLFTVVQQADKTIARRRQVTPGRRLGELIEILSGLSENEPVVVRGNEILRHDQPVNIVGEP